MSEVESSYRGLSPPVEREGGPGPSAPALSTPELDVAWLSTEPDPTVRDPLRRAAEWQERAACRGSMELFFHRGTRPARSFTDRALATCATCPVVNECRELCEVVEHRCVNSNLITGIWGGETPTDRARRRRRERNDIQAVRGRAA